MSATGTIDRPLTHDPQKQALMTSSTSEPAGSATPVFSPAAAYTARQNRTREMQLIPEALARAHMHERQREADAERQAPHPAARDQRERRVSTERPVGERGRGRAPA
ncbi:hypothetical protein, partial [Streptomyces sp. NPDC004285]